MNQRWVCKRCFADNDETAAACVRCNLARGADATSEDQAAWAPAAPQQQAGWQKWLKFAWIPVVVIVVAVGYFISARRDASGEIESGGNLSAFDIQAGDCFSVSSDGDQISDVDAVPCSEPHAFQAYHVQDHETAGYPADDEWDTIFETVCIPPFEVFVGVDYYDSEIYADMMTPSEESYAGGDREYVCYLYELDGSELVGSMEGANR